MLDIIFSGKIKRIIYRNKHAVFRHQRTDFVDHTQWIIGLIDHAFAGAGEKGRINDHAVKFGMFFAQSCHHRKEIPETEIFPGKSQPIKRSTAVCCLQKFVGEIGLQNLCRFAGKRRHAQTAGLSKSIEHAFALHIFQKILAQIAGISIKAIVVVHSQIHGIAHLMFLNKSICFFAIDKFAVALFFIS